MTRLPAPALLSIMVLLVIGLFLSGCVAPSSPVLDSQAPTPALEVIMQGDTPGREEVQAIDLDNCHGKANLTRTEQRTLYVKSTISAEIAVKFGVSAEVLSGEVQAAVGASKEVEPGRSTSIELAAPPGTHMAFQLVWIGDEQIGIVQNLRGLNIPIAFSSFMPTDVRLKSQYDIGCPMSGANQPLASPTAMVPRPPTRSAAIAAPTPDARRACPMIVIEGSIGGVRIRQTKTWAELSQQGTTREPQSTSINDACSRVSGNRVQVWVGYWSQDPRYLEFRHTMTVEEAVALIRQNSGQPALIVPWGE